MLSACWPKGGRREIILTNNPTGRACRFHGPQKIVSRSYCSQLKPSLHISPQEARKLLESAAPHLGVNELADWYNVKAHLLRKLNTSLPKDQNLVLHLCTLAYPEHDWQEWRFRGLSSEWWKVESNQRKFLDWLGKNVFHFNSMENWYSIKHAQLASNGGIALLKLYHRSPPLVIMGVYKEHEWAPWKFNSVPRRWWISQANQRRFCDWVFKQEGLKSLEDWYSVRASVIAKHGGAYLLQQHEGSVFNLITAAYPEHRFEAWRMKKAAGTDFWHRISSGQSKAPEEYVKYLEKKLGISRLADWYGVTRQMLGTTELRRMEFFGGMVSLLQRVYPSHEWDVGLFLVRTRRVRQRRVHDVLKRAFPGTQIFEEYVSQELISPRHFLPLRVDFYLPELKLAVEYQGEQHYTDLFGGLPSEMLKRDEEKMAILEHRGITFIEVPFWWDGTDDTLINTLRKRRPDLTTTPTSTDETIPISPPPWAQSKLAVSKEAVKLCPTVELYDQNQEFSSDRHWIGLILPIHSMRVYWDGKQVLSEAGLRIKVPEGISSALPSNFQLEICLTGTEPYGIQAVEDAISASLRRPVKQQGMYKLSVEDFWRRVQFNIIDLVDLKGGSALNFSQRREILMKLVTADSEQSFLKLSLVNYFEVNNGTAPIQTHAHLCNATEYVRIQRADCGYAETTAFIIKRRELASVNPIVYHERSQRLLCMQDDGLICSVTLPSTEVLQSIDWSQPVIVSHTGRDTFGRLISPVLYKTAK